MRPMFNIFVIGAAAAVIGLSGCAQSTGGTPMVVSGQTPKAASTSADSGSGEPEALFSKFTDIPVPERFSMDADNSLILGGGEEWVGRLVMTTPHGADKMYDFFKREFPGFGWRELTSVRAKTSILAYQRHDRIATVQIESATLRGSHVTIVMSPQVSTKNGAVK